MGKRPICAFVNLRVYWLLMLGSSWLNWSAFPRRQKFEWVSCPTYQPGNLRLIPGLKIIPNSTIQKMIKYG